MENAFITEKCDEKNPKWKFAIERKNPIYSRNDIRSEFERDYTRILHCQAFRRLKHKTQVFMHLIMIMFVQEWNTLCMLLLFLKR